jgi:hypothetical protein
MWPALMGRALCRRAVQEVLGARTRRRCVPASSGAARLAWQQQLEASSQQDGSHYRHLTGRQAQQPGRSSPRRAAEAAPRLPAPTSAPPRPVAAPPGLGITLKCFCKTKAAGYESVRHSDMNYLKGLEKALENALKVWLGWPVSHADISRKAMPLRGIRSQRESQPCLVGGPCAVATATCAAAQGFAFARHEREGRGPSRASASQAPGTAPPRCMPGSAHAWWC